MVISLASIKCYFTVVLRCISPITNDFEHFSHSISLLGYIILFFHDDFKGQKRYEYRYVQPKPALSGSLLAPVAERAALQGHMHLQGLPQLQRTSSANAIPFSGSSNPVPGSSGSLKFRHF